MNWYERLPPKLFTFQGDYHKFRGKHPSYKFEAVGDEVEMKMAPPKTTETPYYFTEQGYAKRLIGNSFSIPTVEILLRPLQALFATQEYPQFSYEFVWTRQTGVVAVGRTDNPAATTSLEVRNTINNASVLQKHIKDENTSVFSGMTDNGSRQDAAAAQLNVPEATWTHGDDAACHLRLLTNNEDIGEGGVENKEKRSVAEVCSLPVRSIDARSAMSAESHSLLKGSVEAKTTSAIPSEKVTDRNVAELHATSQRYGKHNQQHRAGSLPIQTPQLAKGDESVVSKTKSEQSLVLEPELKFKACRRTIDDDSRSPLKMNKEEGEMSVPVATKSDQTSADVVPSNVLKVDAETKVEKQAAPDGLPEPVLEISSTQVDSSNRQSSGAGCHALVDVKPKAETKSVATRMPEPASEASSSSRLIDTSSQQAGVTNGSSGQASGAGYHALIDTKPKAEAKLVAARMPEPASEAASSSLIDTSSQQAGVTNGSSGQASGAGYHALIDTKPKAEAKLVAARMPEPASEAASSSLIDTSSQQAGV
eukprot:CAMPEP_0117007664 /NCGR_PEP_ID=MMETSP0472-20121206/7468_1 /TAXON_ID=693140 ORGANISM="Tiarina fusus, Strain LIS" /NCGR_SAMPLE_ID=MMETSP0472 /ASSEMBLY_ACC=CAM_ASM_000603 /LENGTH=535 /DNA_ID=CAMNT_0004709507 /DNA_START=15 /DNA_END=1618 /DNA_ORIENTATION=-